MIHVTLALIMVLFSDVARAAVTCEEYEKDNPFTLAEWKRDNSRCTGWTKVVGDTCTYKGRDAFLWQRRCLVASPCALELVCLDQNPSKMKTPCFEWWKNENFTCLSPTGKWEQHWARTCTDERLKSQFCSDTEIPKDSFRDILSQSH